MKAYVIKNRDGKYLYIGDTAFDSYFVDDIFDSFFFNSETTANIVKGNLPEDDYQVIETTIAEGDLKKENEVLRRALKLACEEIDRNQGSLSEVAFDYFIEEAKEIMNEQV